VDVRVQLKHDYKCYYAPKTISFDIARYHPWKILLIDCWLNQGSNVEAIIYKRVEGFGV
jgi:hypothetical protein